MDKERSAAKIIWIGLRLYQAHFCLFSVMAFVVTAAYDLVALGVKGSGPNGVGLSLFTVTNGIDVLVVAPLIAAMSTCFATIMGRQLGRAYAVKRVLKLVPIVIAVQVMSYLGMAIAAIAFVLPGIILGLRWSVVSLVVTVESKNPWQAFKRSQEITKGHSWHIFIVTLFVETVVLTAAFITHVIGTNSGSDIAHAGLEIIVQVIIAAYAAMILTVLFFDLLARDRNAAMVEDYSVEK